MFLLLFCIKRVYIVPFINIEKIGHRGSKFRQRLVRNQVVGKAPDRRTGDGRGQVAAAEERDQAP